MKLFTLLTISTWDFPFYPTVGNGHLFCFRCRDKVVKLNREDLARLKMQMTPSGCLSF